MSNPSTPPELSAVEPPGRIVDKAIERACQSPCRSKRGAVVFRERLVIGSGYNYKPEGFECDGSAECKATCRAEAVHAEQGALLRAGLHAQGAEMLHVKVIDGTVMPSGGPSCVQCSKLAVAAGITAMWLYHATGWRRYDIAEFHRLSLAALSVPSGGSPTTKEQEQGDTRMDTMGVSTDSRTAPTVWGTLSIGGLIALLEARDQSEPCRFDFGYLRPANVDSYRGFYEHLALGYVDEGDVTVADVLKRLRAAIGETFCGWKGGEYYMTADTPVWAANRGKAPSTAIVGIADCDYMTILETRHVNV